MTRVPVFCTAATGILLSALLSFPAHAFGQQGATVLQDGGGVTIRTSADVVRVAVCGPAVVHVVASPAGLVDGASPQRPWISGPCKPGKFRLTNPARSSASEPPKSALIDTGTIRVVISLAAGTLEFTDENGARLLQEFSQSARSYDSTTINGEPLYRVSDHFYPEVKEAFYGLGQHQSGVFNYRGSVVELAQANSDVAVPLLVSTNGYGILWNSAAKSWFDNRFATELKLSSDAAQAIDYYFIYGPEMDQIIHRYRSMTGHAPLFGEWAYGFIQSKDRYQSSAELLRIADEYRSRGVPLDVIVQDWFWWMRQGDPEFRVADYPDVPKMLAQLHAAHIHAMLSTWAILDPDSTNYRNMLARGFIIPGTADYDATNPAAGAYYWNHLVGKEFAQGWDAFWLDSSEPELGFGSGRSDAVLENKKLFIGNGALYTNIFPLMHTANVYRHWRETTDQKRVLLLTRSAFFGQQGNAAATWSGDVYSTFLSFQRQLPAGLNFSLSGIPYWTTDIAGYGPPYARDTRDPAYQELYTRWYEFGVFCPLFRTHGHRSNNQNEIFSYGPATPTLARYDRLRYRLLPYIYSLAWQVTHSDGTIMRPLVMDWRTDERVWNIGDQFMFGPSIMVSPVTRQGADSRSIYLPRGTEWYDFWTGEKLQGGRRMQVIARIERIPLYVRAGAILPLGPLVQYAGEHPDGPVELRIYRGANGSFNLYQDSGDTYDYEKGEYAIIPIRWDESSGRVTIGARSGSFPGMARRRTFNIVFVDEKHGKGGELSSGHLVRYSGEPIVVSAQ